jgi:hypothetical protein
MDNAAYFYKCHGAPDENGNYTVGVTAGAWFLELPAARLAAIGYIGHSAVATAVDAAATAQDFNVRRITATLRGRLVDDFGVPVPNMAIYADQMTYSFRRQVTSAADGTFSLGLFGETWSISFDEFDAAEFRGLLAPQMNVALTDGELREGVVFVFMTTTSTISGTVTGVGVGGVSGTYVTADVMAGATNYHASGFTLNDGTYSFRVFNGT